MRGKLVVTLVLLLLAAVGCSTGDDEELADLDGDGDAAVDGDVDADGDAEADLPDGDGDAAEEEGEDDSPPPVECRPEIPLRPLDFAADETFDLGPYLMQPTPTGIVVMWRTIEETDGAVLLGEGDEPERTIEQEGISTIHEIPIDGLEPDTRYGYRVRSGELVSALHHFHTAPEPGQGFRFALWGDNQNGPEVFQTVVAGIAAVQPHILLGVGDHVQTGSEDALWKDQLFGPARALFHEAAFFPAIGNHEQNSQNLYDLYSLPPWSDDPQNESNYSYTYGNTFFLVINVFRIFFPLGDHETELSQWIREQAASPAAQAAAWRIAYAHEPGYSEGWGNGSCTYDGNQPVRGWLLPLLAENRFHAYFAGHTHGYERGVVEGGVVEIISGGGGGGLDAWCLDWPETTVAHYAHHFLNVEVGCDTLRIEATYPDGEVFDWVELASDSWGTLVDEGPAEDLPPPVVNIDSPTLGEQRVRTLAGAAGK
ncbi:MAG: hypothetical protein C4523_08560 [Myxococcales bacterium]|nr:MAG: hypothetical protein C4523_08560 [Myxococcales bacterium]